MALRRRGVPHDLPTMQRRDDGAERVFLVEPMATGDAAVKGSGCVEVRPNIGRIKQLNYCYILLLYFIVLYYPIIIFYDIMLLLCFILLYYCSYIYVLSKLNCLRKQRIFIVFRLYI